MQAAQQTSSGNFIHTLQMTLHFEHQIIKMAYTDLIDVYAYLTSDKFRNDPTVQVADVMRRLDSVRSTLMAGELDSEVARLTKSLVATGEITSL